MIAALPGGLQGCSSGGGYGPGRAPVAPVASPEHANPPPPILETLGFISAASARKPGSAQTQCSQPQSRTEEGGSGAQHLRSGLSRINTKSLLYLPSNLNLSKFPLAVLELREEEILPTV